MPPQAIREDGVAESGGNAADCIVVCVTIAHAYGTRSDGVCRRELRASFVARREKRLHFRRIRVAAAKERGKRVEERRRALLRRH